jgi:3-hydroxybutyryl-CoA dehydrogenase
MRFGLVLVVAAGQMGGGISQVVAASGRRVSLHDEVPGAVERAFETMQRSLEKLAEKGGADPPQVVEGLGDPKHAPYPLLREHVAAGRLGRKSGCGFYQHS